MIVFLSSAASDEFIQRCSEKYSKSEFVYVQQKWDYSLAKAIFEIDSSVLFVSYPPLQTFPAGKKVCFKSITKIENGFSIQYCGFLNLPLFKQKTQVKSIVKIIKRALKEREETELTIITHCFFPQSFRVIKALKKQLAVKVFTVVPDLPEFAGSVYSKSKFYSFFFKKYNLEKLSYKNVPDGYICFSEYQMNYLEKDKHHIVMEGFADIDYIDSIEPTHLKTDKKIFLYVGTLKESYGVNRLIDAFEKANFGNAELWLYGNGDSVDYLKERERKGIFYKGVADRKEIIALEKSAYVLLNPRPIEDEYSKCSFPSKLLEYMATGTPVLTTRLWSLQEQYFDKLFFFGDSSVQGILSGLLEFYKKDEEEVKKVGARAAEFVRREKNAHIQAKRIIDFIKGDKCE